MYYPTAPSNSRYGNFLSHADSGAVRLAESSAVAAPSLLSLAIGVVAFRSLVPIQLPKAINGVAAA